MSTHQPTGRVAVITGASSGIGGRPPVRWPRTATGSRLARRADRIQVLADELGAGAIAVEADVTDRESVVAAADRVEQELGGADILVNNAGVMLTAPFSSDQREEHRRMRASPPTRRPSGGSTAGQRPCASSFSPTSA